MKTTLLLFILFISIILIPEEISNQNNRETPLSMFMGMKWGISKDQFTDTFEFKDKLSEKYGSYTIDEFDFYGKNVSAVFIFKGNTLSKNEKSFASVSLYFKSDNYDSLLAVLIEKYGKPDMLDKAEGQTMAQWIDSKNLREISINKYGSNKDKGNVFFNSFNPKEKLAKIFSENKVLVLKQSGISTMLEKLPGNLGIKTSCPIIIDEEGKWSVKEFLGESYDSTNVLEKGDILRIEKSFFDSKDCFIIRTVTERAIKFNARGRVSFLGSRKATGTGRHANEFIFTIKDDWSYERMLKQIKDFFEVYNEKQESETKEIKVGMTTDEVIEILGEPQKKAVLPDKIIWKFEDTIVTFINEQVSNIEFK